ERWSEASQMRRSCGLGRNRRRVLLLACETLLPVCTLLPVTWQTRDIRTSKGLVSPIARETAAPRPGPRGLAERDAGRGSTARAAPARVPGRSRQQPDAASRQVGGGKWVTAT